MAPTRKREDLAGRQDLLLFFATRLPEGKRDSATGLADFLLELRSRKFVGLAAIEPNEDARRKFEAWVNLGTRASLRKAAERAFGARQRHLGQSVPARAKSPCLLWPIGLRQRKQLDLPFREGLFDPRRKLQGRLFLRCLAPGSMYRVQVSIEGEQVGAWPALAPGEAVELDWHANARIVAIVTEDGWRDEILTYQEMTKFYEDPPASAVKGSPFDGAIDGLIEIGRRRLAQVRAHMPADLEEWKSRVRRVSFVVRYSDLSGTQQPEGGGELRFTMANRWSEFADTTGFAQPIH